MRTYRTNSFLLLAGIGIGLLAVFQLITLFADHYHQRQNEAFSTPDPRLTGNVFRDMRYTHPKNRRPIPQKIVQPSQVELGLPAYAPVSGRADAPFVLTIFTDPACGVCRQEVNHLLRRVPLEDLQVVHRFKANQPNALDAAMMMQVAQKENRAHDFLARVYQRQGELKEDDFIAILEEMGVGLTAQRYHFSRYLDDMLRHVNEDLELARTLGIYQVPSFYLNGYALDSDWMSRERVATYMQRIAAEQDLVQPQDFKRATKQPVL